MESGRRDVESVSRITLIAVSIGGLGLAASGLFRSYSYWFDELYSVTGAIEPLAKEFHSYIFPDVHPPLYALVLRAWELLLRHSEIATRALSFICALFAVFCLTVFARQNLKRGLAYAVIAVFCSNWLFAYYAQETRPYAMLLAFSTLTTCALAACVENPRSRWFHLFVISALLLSLTHYFGLIYAGLCLLAALFWYRSDRLRAGTIIATGIACLIWPLIHCLYGSLLVHTNSVFWIHSNGLQTTAVAGGWSRSPAPYC